MHAFRTLPLAAAILALMLAGCSRKETAPLRSAADSARITAEILQHRAEVDSFFRFDPASPFLNDSLARYDGIKWFPPDVGYCVTSKLHRYESPAAVTVFGTKG